MGKRGLVLSGGVGEGGYEGGDDDLLQALVAGARYDGGQRRDEARAG